LRIKGQDTVDGPLLGRIRRVLEDRKGLDIRVLDVRDLVSYTDQLVLCSGTSTTHVNALVSALRQGFRGTSAPVYVNPSKDDSWWILDFVEVVVHVFREDARSYYDLDRLWGDAKPVP
jgi:ribosome-associated protein